jgi:hypothetical protein
MVSQVSEISEIPSGCFGVTAVDPQTGTLLDQNGNWANDGNGCFYVFATVDEAESYCSEKLAKAPLTEWGIIDDEGNQVGRFANDEAVAEAAQRSAMGKRSWISRLFR